MVKILLIETYNQPLVVSANPARPECVRSTCIEQSPEWRRTWVAIIAGSRHSEIKTLLPLFAKVAASLFHQFPKISFVIPLAESMTENFLREELKKTELANLLNRVEIISGEDNKAKILGQCCLCLSKPGTTTLELALLGVPTVVAFKVSGFSYFIGRMLVKVKFMALPNLLLGEEVFPEFIQDNCFHDELLQAMTQIYKDFDSQSDEYQKRVLRINKIRNIFCDSIRKS